MLATRPLVSASLLSGYLEPFIINDSLSDTLVITDEFVGYRDLNLALVDQLIIFDEYLYVKLFDLELCDFLSISDILGDHYDLDLEDTLTLTEEEREILEDLLDIIDDYVTNMDDDETCYNPGGTAPERENGDNLTITDSYAVTVDYNITQVETLTINQTNTWRI